MIWAITMPTWGLSMEEGTIVGWRVAEGSPTAAGVELVEIETSKIANSLEAREAGVLRRQLAMPGQIVACGELIGIIATDAVSESEIDAFIAKFHGRGRLRLRLGRMRHLIRAYFSSFHWGGSFDA
jgi:pyruvate dehydrogenase E2 component (dihydrolipoamide acetyltransferase)